MVDGDICASYDSDVFINGSQKETTNPITYDKQSAPSHKICHRNFVETDIRGFGTKVGTYSNYSTIIEAMLAMFQREDLEKQREELLTRKKLLREINGQEIDRIKGVEAEGPPKDDWLKFQKINEDDDDITKSEKYYHNSLIISKKPYFFRYLYPELNKQYKAHENQYNEKSKALFGIKLKKLLVKEDKTEEQKALIRRYHKFSPLITSNCTMNRLCREFESIDFDIKWAKTNECLLPHLPLETFEFDRQKLDKFKIMYRKWSNRKQINHLAQFFDEDDQDYREARFNILDNIREEIQSEESDLGLTTIESLTYIWKLSEQYSKFNFDFAYDLLDERILDCITSDTTYAAVESEDGKEYLGKKYKLIEIPKNQGEENAALDE